MSESSDEDCLTPPEILQEAMAITSNLLPQKSKKKYEKLYEQFMDWKVKQNITSFSENVMIVNFEQLSESNKASTLWVHYSILKTTLNIKHKLDISKYAKLYTLLKRKSEGYQPKKSKTFSPTEIKTFIDEAPDDKYLLLKVSIVF